MRNLSLQQQEPDQELVFTTASFSPPPETRQDELLEQEFVQQYAETAFKASVGTTNWQLTQASKTSLRASLLRYQQTKRDQ